MVQVQIHNREEVAYLDEESICSVNSGARGSETKVQEAWKLTESVSNSLSIRGSHAPLTWRYLVQSPGGHVLLLKQQTWGDVIP